MAGLDVVKTWPVRDWSAATGIDRAEARRQLELGHVLFFPRLAFPLEAGEERFLTGRFAEDGAKNISLRRPGEPVRGAVGSADDLAALGRLVARYAEASIALVRALVPDYARGMTAGATSLRTKEIAGRELSWRKDDTRLHVDAFPSNPLQGRRVLRVFNNIDPDGVAREWRVGEPFADFAGRFAPKTTAPFEPALWALWKLGVTKRRRTEYDTACCSCTTSPRRMRSTARARRPRT
jgi:hypothetical protein